jgi:glycosyltransferase involved in cell wall biosynthesis
MPLVTVVMPAFNAERYIAQALASVRQQTLRDIELIVVDDGSTDNTIEIAGSFASALDLRILNQRNRGPSVARNAAIRRARGRYCAFLDADDVMCPELLERQVAALEADSKVTLVVADVTTFDERGDIHEARWQLEQSNGSAFDRLLVENFVTTSAAMAPTEALLAVGLFPEDRRVAEDYEVWIRLGLRGRIALIPQPLVRYRYTTGSLSSDKVYSARAALDVVEQFWREHPHYRREKPHVARRSMARHLRNAAAASEAAGQRLRAVQYALRSLSQAPSALPTWKVLLKGVVPYRALRAWQRERPVKRTIWWRQT